MTIGTTIRTARVRTGLSLRDAAHLLSMPHQHLDDIERGDRRVPPRLLSPMAHHLEIDRDVLVAEWLEDAGRTPLELPADASPLARQVFVALAAAWPDLARAGSASARGTLAVIRWALSRPI